MDQRLFRGEVRAAQVTLWHEPHEGWRLTVAVRRDFEEWSESSADTYERLSLSEALDVLDTCLGAIAE